MNESRSKHRLLKLSGALLGASILGFVMIMVAAMMFDEFDRSSTASTILGYTGITVYSVAAFVGVVLAGITIIRRGTGASYRFAAALLGTIHLFVFLSAIYIVSNPFRHWVLLTAARNGVRAAYDDVGWDYMMGRGVPKSVNEGLRWLKAAADSGDNNTMLEYSRLHGTNFWGVPTDPYVEEEYHRRAAEAGNYSAHVEREAREWVRTHPSEASNLK